MRTRNHPRIWAALLMLALPLSAAMGPRPVAQGKPNAFGLYDMAGNVLEWTASGYDKAYLDKQAMQEDGKLKVLRGGSWLDAPFNLRSADRQPLDPGLRDSKYGFRCALPLASASRAPAGMKSIPAGKYAMGSTLASDERPVHEVSVEGFYLDSTEVTQAAFQELMGYNPSRYPVKDHPVERVNWYDAVRFANARSKAEGLEPAYAWDSVCVACTPWEYTQDALFNSGLGSVLSGLKVVAGSPGYRLPSEEEWEYAARAGSTTDYHWGRNYSAYPPASDVSELANHAAWRGNSFDLGGPEPMPQQEVPAAPAPDPAIKVVRCSTSAQLMDLFYRGMDQSLTILLKDGEYDLAYWIYGNDGNGTELLLDKPNTTLMGESKDPRKVIIRGRGFNAYDYSEECIKVVADNVTLAYFTLKDVRANGVKIQGSLKNLLIHNVHFEDIGERSIKAPRGTAANPVISQDVTVRYCAFSQFTAISMDRAAGERNGLDYIGGIDVMGARNWRVQDNVFRNFRGPNGLARGGVFFWVNCASLLIERNVFWKCDRGIALGNPSGSDFQYHVDSALVRNNLISHSPYFAVEVCSTSRARFYNNTIYTGLAKPQAFHLWRNWNNNSFRNNFVVGTIMKNGGGQYLDTVSNYWIPSATATVKGWFQDPDNGDFHITEKASGLIDKGFELTEVPTDWEGQGRSGKPDIGMDELGAVKSALRPARSRSGDPYLRGQPASLGGSLVFSLGNPAGRADFTVYDPGGKTLWAAHGLNLDASGGRIVWPASAGAWQGSGRFLAVLACEGGMVSRLAFPILP